MIIGLFPGLADAGGVQVAGRQTAAALTAIACGRRWPFVFLSLNDPPGEHEISVGKIPFRYTGFGRRKLAFLAAALRLASRKPKLIFAAHPNLAPVAAAMKAIARSAKAILGAHGIEVWRPLPLMRRWALRCADIVVAPSADTMVRLEKKQGVLRRKIRRLPWPLDPEFAELAAFADALAPPSGFPEGQVILTVGRWAADERYKGADILMEAIAELAPDFPQVQLVLVGSGDDTARLKQHARNLAIEDRVHFVSGLSRLELARYYAAADIFALPSTGEGFGLVFLEAMAFGKPVIGTSIGGIPDVVKNGQDGLLVEPTKEGVSAALRSSISDQVLRNELGAQGKRKATTEFTFDNFQRRLFAIVNEIV